MSKILGAVQTSIFLFLEVYKRIKDIEVSDSIGLDEIKNFSIKNKETLELQEMSDIYSNTLSVGATSAATGAIIALAATGSLPAVTDALTAAGSLALAGNIGAAAGLATTALSLTPLAAVAAPVLLFTGISSSIKADENLEKAKVSYAEAEAAVEKMEITKTLCKAISERADMFDNLLFELNSMFLPCTQLLERVTRKKMGFFKKKIKQKDLTEDEIKLIAITRSLAGAIKSVIDTPILTAEGNISEEACIVYEKTNEKLSDFSNVVTQINQCEFKQAKPKQIKFKKNKEKSKNNLLKKSISLLIFTLIIIIGIYFYRENRGIFTNFPLNIINKFKIEKDLKQNFNMKGNENIISNFENEEEENIILNSERKENEIIEPVSEIKEEKLENNQKYQGTERNQFIILNGEEVYIDEEGNILRG